MTRNADAPSAAATDVPAADVPDVELAVEWRALLALGPHLAHELRSPLNNIVIQLDLLEKVSPLESAGSDRLERRRDMLSREVTRLRQSVDRLIALLVPSSEPLPWMAEQLLEELVQLTSGMAQHRGVRIEVGAGSEPIPVHVDRRQVRRALLGLLVDRLLDRSESGSTVRLACETSGERLLLSIVVDPEEAPADQGLEPTAPAGLLGENLRSAGARVTISAQGSVLSLPREPQTLRNQAETCPEH